MLVWGWGGAEGASLAGAQGLCQDGCVKIITKLRLQVCRGAVFGAQCFTEVLTVAQPTSNTTVKRAEGPLFFPQCSL